MRCCTERFLAARGLDNLRRHPSPFHGQFAHIVDNQCSQRLDRLVVPLLLHTHTSLFLRKKKEEAVSRSRLAGLGIAVLGALSLNMGLGGIAMAQSADAPPPVLAWTPKPVEPAPYTGVHQMHTRLSEVLASHEGEDSWHHQVVDDKHLRAAYVQMAAGETSPTLLLADHRTSFIVWDGEVEVTIGDQDPFIATKGFMVQVPFRTPFTLANVGDRPSLHFEIFNANATLLYPEAAEADLPEAPEGHEWYLSRLDKPDTYERQDSKPYLDFFWEVENTEKGPNGPFTKDDRSFVNIIRGTANGVPSPTNIGHFHVDYAEFWFVMEGQISYLIEGADFFVADAGDVVYVPPGRFHRAAFHGDTPSTRIAINGYPFGSHHWPTPH